MTRPDARAVRSRAKMAKCRTVPDAEREVRRLLTSVCMMDDELGEIRRSQRECERAARMFSEGLTKQRPPGSGPKGKGRHADPTFEAARRVSEWYQEQCRQMESRTVELMLRRELLDELMKGLSDVERRIIKLKWVEGKPWSQVSTQVFLCDRQAQRIQKSAIRRMAERYIMQSEAAARA